MNARAGLAVMSATALGVNDAVWDKDLGTPAVSDLLKGAGVAMMRYPDGSYGDIYHWKDNTAPGGYVAPGTAYANAYVAKPLELDELDRVIDQVLNFYGETVTRSR